MKQIFSVLLIFSTHALSLYSQILSNNIQGRILASNDSSSIINALVQIQENDKVINHALTDEKGKFKMQSTCSVNRLIVSYMGYRDSISITQIAELGDIYIDIPIQSLSELEVTAKRPIVRYDAGKTIYDLNAMPGIQGSDAVEAIGRIPGIQYQSDQGFLLKVLDNLIVLLDKRHVRMSSTELESYLSSIPVTDIASVEIIQNPSPEYGSNGAPILNIVTKKHLEDGYNAYITTRAVYQYYMREQVSARFNLNKGISRSYISYSINDTRMRETTEVVGLSTTHDEVKPRITHNIGIGSLLKLSDTHSLDINIYGTLQNEHHYYSVDKGNKLNRSRGFASLVHTFQNSKIETRTAIEGALASLKQNALIKESTLLMRDNSNFIRIAPTITYNITKSLNII